MEDLETSTPPAKRTKRVEPSPGSSSSGEVDNKRELTSSELASVPGKLKLEDVKCPICWSVLIKPVTLPCNHTLCKSCLKKHLENNPYLCPCCRKRLSVWCRRTKDNVVDEALWNRIKSEFPQAEARLRKMEEEGYEDDDDDESVDRWFSASDLEDSDDLETHTAEALRDGDVHNQTNINIMEYYQTKIFKPHVRDIEVERRKEEAASLCLARELEEEERRRVLKQLELDRLEAEKLQREFDETQNEYLSQIESSDRLYADKLQKEFEAAVEKDPIKLKDSDVHSVETLKLEDVSGASESEDDFMEETSVSTPPPNSQMHTSISSPTLDLVNSVCKSLMEKFEADAHSSPTPSCSKDILKASPSQPFSPSPSPKDCNLEIIPDSLQSSPQSKNRPVADEPKCVWRRMLFNHETSNIIDGIGEFASPLPMYNMELAPPPLIPTSPEYFDSSDDEVEIETPAKISPVKEVAEAIQAPSNDAVKSSSPPPQSRPTNEGNETRVQLSDEIENKRKQEKADEEYARLLQRRYNLGLFDARGRGGKEAYGLRSWKKD